MTRLDLDPVARFDPATIAADAKPAAVLVPVVSLDGGDRLVFTKRAPELGDHPGQMSFPGGGVEPVDGSLVETALREADEEIGLRAVDADVVGRLDDIRTTTGYVVTPYVARVPHRDYDPQLSEVAEIADLPVDALLDPSNYRYERRDDPDRRTRGVHYFTVDGYTVWGATARILVQLLKTAARFSPPEAPDRPEE